MINAKLEVLEKLQDKTVRCAEILYDGENKHLNLKLNHSEDDLAHWLNSLDFAYDAGYGGQELFGTIWLENGEWLERGEYDGSEWWELRSYPEIPERLK